MIKALIESLLFNRSMIIIIYVIYILSLCIAKNALLIKFVLKVVPKYISTNKLVTLIFSRCLLQKWVVTTPAHLDPVSEICVLVYLNFSVYS